MTTQTYTYTEVSEYLGEWGAVLHMNPALTSDEALAKQIQDTLNGLLAKVDAAVEFGNEPDAELLAEVMDNFEMLHELANDNS